MNKITHFFTLYIFLQNNINITRNILLGLKWLKIAFHLEPSFSLVLMWMQHTRQIINRKVNRSPSQMQLIFQFCVFFLSSMNLLENSSTKKKKNLLEKNKSQFWSFIKVQIGLWVSYSHSHHSLSLSLYNTTHSVIANYQMTVSQFSATFSIGWLEKVLTCAWNPSKLPQPETHIKLKNSLKS